MDAQSAAFDPKRFTVVDHPLVQHKLHILRDEQTGTNQFRQLVTELAIFEGYEAMRDFPLEDVEVKTPLETASCKRLAGKKVAVVPILRAGLGMVDGILQLVPSARVGHVGMFRDPETHEPHPYYCKLPSDVGERTCLVVDPMLATAARSSRPSSTSERPAPRTSAASRWSRRPRASPRCSRQTPTSASTPARSTAASTRTPTSDLASAMRATASSERSRAARSARFSLPSLLRSPLRGLFGTVWRTGD